MRVERSFALIQLDKGETQRWHSTSAKMRKGVQTEARRLAQELADSLGDEVEICADGGEVLEVVKAKAVQTATV